MASKTVIRLIVQANKVYLFIHLFLFLYFIIFIYLKEMLEDVEDYVCWKSNFVQPHRTSCKNVQLDDSQTSATCWIQECWTLLHQHVASVWPGFI